METPDPIELVKLQERNEGLNMLIEEKNRSIERLEKEVNRLDLFSRYFKSDKTQMLEAPAAEKVKAWWKFCNLVYFSNSYKEYTSFCILLPVENNVKSQFIGFI